MLELLFPNIDTMAYDSPARLSPDDAQAVSELASSIRAGKSALTQPAFELLAKGYIASMSAFQPDYAETEEAKSLSLERLKAELPKALGKRYLNEDAYPSAAWSAESELATLGDSLVVLCGAENGLALVRLSGENSIVPLSTLVKTSMLRLEYL